MLSVIQSYEEQMPTRHLIDFACNLSNSFIFCFDMNMDSQPYNSTDLHVLDHIFVRVSISRLLWLKPAPCN